jgi:hypothetical protein
MVAGSGTGFGGGSVVDSKENTVLVELVVKKSQVPAVGSYPVILNIPLPVSPKLVEVRSTIVIFCKLNA